MIFSLIITCLVVVNATFQCEIYVSNNDSYDYGWDVVCSKLTPENVGNLTNLSIDRLSTLKIEDSTLPARAVFATLTNMKFLAITNSTLLFNQNEKPFKDLSQVEELTIENTNLQLNAHFFDGLNNLHELNLINNNIHAIRNRTLKSLPKLKILKLSKNDFASMSDLQFCDLLQLEVLHLDYNRFKIINKVNSVCEFDENDPAIVKNRRKKVIFALKELNLSFNKIEFVENIDWAFRLKKINLEGNHLKLLSVDTFASLHNLEDISLKNNSLESLDRNVFSRLKKLKRINFKNNNLQRVFLANLTLLEEIDLSKNALVSDNLKYLSGLSKLKSLSLSHNNITTIDEDTFKNISFLQNLDLSHNNLRFVNDQPFYGFAKLRKLDIGHNNIKILPFNLFSNLSNLQFLDLSCNKLTTINTKIFLSISNLKFLNVSHNQLESLQYNLWRPLQKLEELDLSYNRIRNINFNITDIFPLLKTFNIHDNQLDCETYKNLIKLFSSDNIYYNVSNNTVCVSEILDLTKSKDSTKTGDFPKLILIGLASILSCLFASILFYRCLSKYMRRRRMFETIQLIEEL